MNESQLDKDVDEILSKREAPEWLKRLWQNVKITAAIAAIVTALAFMLFTGFTVQQANLAKAQGSIESARLSAFIQTRNPKVPVELADIMGELILKTSKASAVPHELVVGIIEKESLFNPFAVSSADACGIMQVLVGNKPIDKKRVHSLEYNLEMGTTILHEKLKASKGDLNRALELYSGGAGGYTDGVLTAMGRYILFMKSKEIDDVKESVQSAAEATGGPTP